MPDLTNGQQTSLLPRNPEPPVTEEFLRVAREWCEAHRDKVQRCVVARFEGYPALFILPTQAGYDFELSKVLAQWEMELARSGFPSLVIQMVGGEPASPSGYYNEQRALPVFDKDSGCPNDANC